jgi:acetyl-CoA acetyltransferase family protein
MPLLKEVVVIDAVRSAIGKSGVKGMEKKGQLCHASAQDLLANTMRGLLDRVKEKAPKFDEREIEEVVVGCQGQVGEQGGNIARMSTLIADIPRVANGVTVHQYCNSGLKAITMGACTLKAGDGDIILCGGVEILSHYRMGAELMAAVEANYPVYFSARMEEVGMTTLQGPAAEKISEERGHTREELDQFGWWSMKKAVEAERNGWFADHIIPFEVTWEGEIKTVHKDEVLRPKAVDDPEGFLKDIAGLKTPFKEGGMVTPGNSSQIVDGAAAVLLMTADKAEKLGLEPMCRIVSHASVGDSPFTMLLGLIPAAQRALDRAGMTMDQMDIIEPNEAFATPLLVLAEEFGYAYDDPRVNPTGGAIALGHPIGASGVIYFGEMVHQLKRTKGKRAIQMICGGGGLGIATVVESV